MYINVKLDSSLPDYPWNLDMLRPKGVAHLYMMTLEILRP